MKLLIIGATGLVGKKLLYLLEKNKLNISKICFVASKKNKNKLLYFNSKYYLIKTINDIKFKDYTHACILTNSDISKQITPSLLFNHVVVIDNSSAYRNIYNLTIPEINYKKNKKVYINPNCCVIQSAIPLHYINTKYKLDKLIINTYQSCSGGGYNLLNELNNNKINNCIPFVGEVLDNNYTSEEYKISNELNKVLNTNIEIFSNTVRVPTRYGHLVNIIFECSNCTITNIYNILCEKTNYVSNFDNIDIVNDFNIYSYRLKQLNNNTFSFYTYANNLLRGASYNSYLTLKYIQKNYT